jgi:hypothetical protein
MTEVTLMVIQRGISVCDESWSSIALNILQRGRGLPWRLNARPNYSHPGPSRHRFKNYAYARPQRLLMCAHANM